MTVWADSAAGVPISRSELRTLKAGHATDLREQDPDLALRTIAELIVVRFGGACSPKTVADYLWDPDGSKAKARKVSYRGQCRGCGAPTSGGDGPRAPRELCQRCKHTRQGSRARRHSQESIKATLRAWYRQEGFWPTSTDLKRDRAERRGRDALRRYETYGLPGVAVIEHFGSFAAGLAAAKVDEPCG
jgi:hypothetical protein